MDRYFITVQNRLHEIRDYCAQKIIETLDEGRILYGQKIEPVTLEFYNRVAAINEQIDFYRRGLRIVNEFICQVERDRLRAIGSS